MSLRTLTLTRTLTSTLNLSSSPIRRLSTTARIMALPTQQRAWIVANQPSGPIQPDTFKVETRPLPGLGDDSVLLRVDYISNDPTQRNWIAKGSNHVKQGDVFSSSALATVIKSNSPKWKEGQLVIGYFGWVDYTVVPATAIQREVQQLPGRPAIALGVLGATGATAYHGIMDILDVQPEHTVVVSGAAG
jgi:NADPH-dependent curcumin reductase CurA